MMTGITPVTVTFLAQEILPKGQRFLFSGIVVDPVQVEIPFGSARPPKKGRGERLSSISAGGRLGVLV